ncbi:hypothetical protein [Ochrobactrum sp. AP1BH01-1]|uniref:hypothetical protein n=1 Tax=Ochrobactrum sp. AP1BH01-1 TaxID=2823874 RepID=UPI001B3986F2|nr:hypothetical protein [Ochrobactrum sp. AP1BH01-1]MBQ0707871.1 hypothetical protein [Ochrobactrum sp. AP1BH01-1]
MSTEPRLLDERIALLNDLEHEAHIVRDLVCLISEHLNEVYRDDVAHRSKTDINVATTLAIVARDRMDAAVARMNATYGITEAAQ